MLDTQVELCALPVKLWNAGRHLIFGTNPCPISKLSPEVLGEIFLWCLPTDGFQSTLDPPRLSLEPLTLSHVSSRWRTVSLSTPSLWSTIWVDRPQDAHISMVELWLERSRAYPLTLYLRQTVPLVAGQQSFAHPFEFDLTEEILIMLAMHLDRWKRVTFLLYHGTQMGLLDIPQSADAAPLLEHVQLSVKQWAARDGEEMERILYSFPSVKSVVIHPYMSQNFVLDAKQLPCTINNYLHVLRHCSVLQQADIRCTYDGDTRYVPPPPHGRLRLSRLSSFTVHADRVDLRPLFDNLILTSLEGLVLRYFNAPRRSDDHQALARLLTYSACVLRRFSLRDAAQTPNDDHILGFLALPQMAGLNELYLQAALSDKIISFLTFPDVEDEPALRPLANLHTISLLDLQGEHLEDLVLYRMVVSRLTPVSTRVLRAAFFSLRLKGHMGSAVLPWLVERCRGRIDLRIYLAQCEDPAAKVGWYTSAPIPGGYLTDG
ncbi:hypothetical protein FB45DRAFT_890768 [Roridomyces roridus]|uniref:F-box domain-containing protein n=1 Tax=Roridomyces roridus TaxID=1738132 RepID=A0AAD7CDQ2_9AGAR|nr:hypothetical protein FB45DRAFT_890768 [Roridomyces roridus]